MEPLAPLLLLAALLLVVPAQAQQIPFQGIAPVPMTAVGSNLVAKSSPGNLIAFLGTTGSTAGCFFVFNATSLPGNADAPLSISAGRICVGALPPFTARSRIRIAGLPASPCTGWTARLPKP